MFVRLFFLYWTDYNMTTKYTYKEIWIIAYPILISLIMEQLIGMTDTAFLGRGRSRTGSLGHCRVYYLAIFMMAFDQYRCTNPWLPVVTVNSNTRLSGPSFIRVSTFCFHRSGSIHFFAVLLTAHTEKRSLARSIRCVHQLHQLEGSAFSSPLSE